jgi:hypothetical protein
MPFAQWNGLFAPHISWLSSESFQCVISGPVVHCDSMQRLWATGSWLNSRECPLTCGILGRSLVLLHFIWKFLQNSTWYKLGFNLFLRNTNILIMYKTSQEKFAVCQVLLQALWICIIQSSSMELKEAHVAFSLFYQWRNWSTEKLSYSSPHNYKTTAGI